MLIFIVWLVGKYRSNHWNKRYAGGMLLLRRHCRFVNINGNDLALIRVE
jgi:hypothetical protein